MTDDGAQVDAVWLTLSEAAKSKGISKQAISKRLKVLASAGRMVSTQRVGKELVINIAEYDYAVGMAGDAIRAQEQKVDAFREPRGGSLAKAQAERTSYLAEIARLELEQRIGKLLPVADIERAVERCAEAIVSIIERMPSQTDDPTIQRILKGMAREVRQELAKSLQILAINSENEVNLTSSENHENDAE